MPTRNKVTRRKFAELLGIGGAIGLAGCVEGDGTNTTEPGEGGAEGGTSENPTPEGTNQGGHLRVSVAQPPNSINPLGMQAKWNERWGVGLMYSTLTKIDSDLTVFGDLATDWQADDDIVEWTFTLHEDATFRHLNRTVKAQDVKATFDAVYNPDIGSVGEGTMGNIQSVEVLSDTEIKFTLGEANPDFPVFVAKRWGCILPEEKVSTESGRQELNSTDFGSGPFNLEEYEAGDHITVSKNEGYYQETEDGTKLPYLDRVTQQYIPEVTSEINSLRNGEIDMMYQTPPNQMNEIESLENVVAGSVPSGHFIGLVMNVNTPPFDDVRVRQALKHAVNREEFVQVVANGYGSKGQDSILSPAYKYYHELPEREQDLEKARSLLAEAGYPDGFHLGEDFGLTFYTAREPPARLQGAILLQDQLKDIGVTLPLEQVNRDYYLNNVLFRAPCYMTSVGARFTEDGFLSLLLTCDGQFNESEFCDEEFQTAIENARQTTDSEARQEHYATAQRILYERGPYLVPLYLERTTAYYDYVENYQTHPLRWLLPDQISLSDSAPTLNSN